MLSLLLEGIDALGAMVGLSGAQFRFVFCLIMCYPFGYLHRLLPTSKRNEVKHIYSILMGLLQAYICFGNEVAHFVVATFITYVIMRLFPSRCGWLAFFYNMIHITWGNYDRMINDYLGYSLNWTVPYMILLCKLTSLAWNYEDGHINADVVAARDKDGFQRAHMIEKPPNLMEVYSYALFFGGFLSGPWSDFAEYRAFTDLTMFSKEPQGKIPFPSKFLVNTIICIAIAIVGHFLGDKMEIYYLVSHEYGQLPFLQRVLWYFSYTEVFYFKYYVVWWLGEGATAICGLSYNGRDSKGLVRWDRIRMLNLIKYKFAESITRDCVPNWNMSSQHWLKRYVHQRFLTLKFFSTTASRIATFATSAIWHGLYPGYYVFFGFAAIFAEITWATGILVAPVFFNQDGTAKKSIYPIYRISLTAFIWIIIDYLAPSFQLMAFQYGLTGFNRIYWFGHIIMVIPLIVFFLVKMVAPGYIKYSSAIYKKSFELEKAAALKPQAGEQAAAGEKPKSE